MSGLLQSIFQNFRKFLKMIDVDVLVVGSGGAGAQGGLTGGTGAYVSGTYHNATTYYASGGHSGGNAGNSGIVVTGQTKIMSSSTYFITIAPGAICPSHQQGNTSGIGNNGSSSYITGPFPDSVSSILANGAFYGSTVVVGGFPGVINASGGLGGIGQGGGAPAGHAFPPAYLGRTTTSTVFASNISGTNSYYGNGNTGGGLSGGGPPFQALAGANATNYGQGGGGGYGGVYEYFSAGYYMFTGGLGGNSGAGIAIIRCRQSDFVSYTMAGGAATTTTSNGIVYSIFTFTTSGSITFHST